MKNLTIAILSVLLTAAEATVFADEVPAEAAPLTLASADITASTNLQATESNDLGARLDREVKASSEALNAKVTAELAAQIAKEVASVKF